MSDPVLLVKEACAYIEVVGARGTARGTGYLVGELWAATCAHVVRDVPAGGQVVLRFPRGERTALVAALDERMDCALLRLHEPLGEIAPLPMSDACALRDPWEAYGFPAVTGQAGLLLTGDVHDPAGEDPGQAPALVLFSRNATAGAQLGGFSGSPVLIGGQVVGHLKRVIPDEGGGSAMGLLYACPARFLRALLPSEAAPAVPLRPDAPFDPRCYVHREVEERRALQRLRDAGAPVVLQGPRMFGKATLLGYLLHELGLRAPQAGDAEGMKGPEGQRAVRVVLPELPDAALGSLDTLLRELGLRVVTSLGVEGAEAEVDKAWRRPGSEKNRLRWLLEKQALGAPGVSRLYLCLEQADAVQGRPFQHDFFAMLRAFAEDKSELWGRLRLLVTVATESTQLESADHSAFFALATPIRLNELDRAQVRALCRLYGIAASEDDLECLHSLLGGHPFLPRLFLYEAVLQGVPLRRLAQDTTGEGGVFADHLFRLRHSLERKGLLDAVCGVLRDARHHLDLGAYCHLYEKGLLVEERPGHYRLRCRLYEDYFATLCGVR